MAHFCRNIWEFLRSILPVGIVHRKEFYKQTNKMHFLYVCILQFILECCVWAVCIIATCVGF